MGDSSLTFAELERRIKEIPDGPSAVLNTPPALSVLNAIGTLGAVVGLLPSLLILFVAPQQWMVTMAQAGVIVAFVFHAPYIAHGVWVFAAEMRQ